MLMSAKTSAQQAAFEFAFRREPREMPLRSAGDSRFTAWRGRSGRRYVVSSYPADGQDALAFSDAVLIAVDRDRQIVALADSGPWGLEAAMESWRRDAVAAGACEIHVHLIAPDREARQRVIADLTPDQLAAAA